jgi:hypothetical protein
VVALDDGEADTTGAATGVGIAATQRGTFRIGNPALLSQSFGL